MVREREREYLGLNKIESTRLKVHEKGIQTRQNRAGVIREINNIKPEFDKSKHRGRQRKEVSVEDSREGN